MEKYSGRQICKNLWIDCNCGNAVADCNGSRIGERTIFANSSDGRYIISVVGRVYVLASVRCNGGTAKREATVKYSRDFNMHWKNWGNGDAFLKQKFQNLVIYRQH